MEKFKTLFVVKSSLITLYVALTLPIPFISIEELKVIKENTLKLSIEIYGMGIVRAK